MMGRVNPSLGKCFVPMVPDENEFSVRNYKILVASAATAGPGSGDSTTSTASTASTANTGINYLLMYLFCSCSVAVL